MNRPIEEIIVELVEQLPDPRDAFVDRQHEQEIREVLGNIRGLPEFLKMTMSADMRRYFSASPEEQEQIKGAFRRTAYFLSLAIPKANMEFVKDTTARQKA